MKVSVIALDYDGTVARSGMLDPSVRAAMFVNQHRGPRASRDSRTSLSANQEVEHDRDEHVDRRGAKTSRLEPPLGNGRHGFFVEAPCVQRTDDTDLRRASVGCDDDFQHNRALNAVWERLARVLGLDFFDQARCGYCPARRGKCHRQFHRRIRGRIRGHVPSPCQSRFQCRRRPRTLDLSTCLTSRRRSAVQSDRTGRRPAASHRARSMGAEERPRRQVRQLSSPGLLAAALFALAG